MSFVVESAPRSPSSRLSSNHERPARKLGHRPGLDGLRGVAWLLVFVGHVQPFATITPADTGMFVFFALSGFLITQLLVAERQKNGEVELWSFLKRRVARLVPALVVFLVIWLLVVVIFSGSPWLSTVPQGGPAQHVGVTVAVEGVLASLTYVINWVQIFNGFSGYVPIGHIWSLAVEMQFYVLWASVLVFLLRRGRKWALWSALAGSTLGTLEGIFLMHYGSSGLRVYMGTDVRAGALLAGSSAALIWSFVDSSLFRSKLFSAIGALSVTTLIWSVFAFKDPTLSIAQQLAWPLTAVASVAVVVYVVERESTRAASWVTHPTLVYLGKRSYGLYLWHYVWLTWFRAFGIVGISSALLMSLICAELSWRLVERPASAWIKSWSRRPKSSGKLDPHKELELVG